MEYATTSIATATRIVTVISAAVGINISWEIISYHDTCMFCPTYLGRCSRSLSWHKPLHVGSRDIQERGCTDTAPKRTYSPVQVVRAFNIADEA